MRKLKKKALLGQELPKPFMQSNTFAGSAQEDANTMKVRDWDYLSDAERNQNKDPKNRRSPINIMDYINPAITLAEAFIPQDYDRFKAVQPQESYNPNPYGTGSQAIAKKGAKMKGKAQFGEDFGGPPKGITYVNADRSYLSDAVGYSLAQGGNPLNHELGKSLITQPGGKKLIDAIIAYNSNPASINSSPDDRINNFYSTTSQDPEIEAFKKNGRMLSKSSSPAGFYHTSPNVDVQGDTTGRQMLAKMPDGGELTPYDSASSKKYGLPYNKLSFEQQLGIQRGLQPIEKKYEPSGAVKKAKSALAVASVAPVVGPLAGWIGAGADLATSMRYAADGQYENATQDLLSAGLDMVPYAGKINKLTKSVNGLLKTGKVYANAATVKESFKKGGDIGAPLSVESYNPISEDTLMIEGSPHSEGGTDVQYGNKVIEAEKGEPLSIGADGQAIIWGNLNVPGTKEKFKNVVKKIGEQEAKYDKLGKKGLNLISDFKPINAFDKIKLTTGKVMTEGAERGKADLFQKKEELSELQSMLLAKKEQKKAKDGAIIAASGTKIDPTPKFLKLEALAQAKLQAMYPGKNVRVQASGLERPIEEQRGLKAKGYSKTSVSLHNVGGAKDYQMYVDGKLIKDTNIYKDVIQSSAKEVGFFGVGDWDAGHVGAVEEGTGKAFSTLLAQHPDLKTKDGYKKTTSYIKKLIDTGKADKQEIQAYNQLTGSKIPLSKGVMKAAAPSLPQGEYFGESPISVTIPPLGKFKLPNIPLTTRPVPSSSIPDDPIPPTVRLRVPEDPKKPSNVEPLHFEQVAPELLAYAQNKVEPVPMQQLNPTLYSPYQVSYQDRLNNNNSSFRALTQQLSSNPSALQSIAANKYAADSQVQAEEFRTNQGISNEVTNKNVALLNDAEYKNLGLSDQQMVRQSQAKSNTRTQNGVIFNSLANKYNQNALENRTLAAYENLYDYRFVDTDQDGTPDDAQYFGAKPTFSAVDDGVATGSAYSRKQQEYDGAGNLKKTRVMTPSQKQQEELDLNIERKKKTVPKFSFQRLIRNFK